MRGGATIIDPDHTVIDVGVTLAPDTLIEPGTRAAWDDERRGGLGDRAAHDADRRHGRLRLGGDPQLRHRRRRSGTASTSARSAYLRPGTVLREGSKAGTFVEIKNSEVGARTKVPHLSYIGDATIGEDTNLGASTITANYDGYAKHRTTIGSRVHTRVDTTLVAPVEIGDDTWIGAGSVITKDVPDGALGIARERQRNIEGYADRVRERHAADADDEPQPTSGGGLSSC